MHSPWCESDQHPFPSFTPFIIKTKLTIIKHVGNMEMENVTGISGAHPPTSSGISSELCVHRHNRICLQFPDFLLELQGGSYCDA